MLFVEQGGFKDVLKYGGGKIPPLEKTLESDRRVLRKIQKRSGGGGWHIQIFGEECSGILRSGMWSNEDWPKNVHFSL